MTVKLLVDMKLSPDWVPLLVDHGWSAVHWSDLGDPGASDRAIMEWAVTHEYVVFTHDLDLWHHVGRYPTLRAQVCYRFGPKMYSPSIWEHASLLPSGITTLICRGGLWSWWTRAGVDYGSCPYDLGDVFSEPYSAQPASSERWTV